MALAEEKCLNHDFKTDGTDVPEILIRDKNAAASAPFREEIV